MSLVQITINYYMHIIITCIRYKKKNDFAVHYVKDGPKLVSTSSPEPQYATCSAPDEYDYVSGLYMNHVDLL